MAIVLSMSLPIVVAGGKSLCLISVLCCIGILFHLLFLRWLHFVVCVYLLVKCWEFLFWHRRGLASL